MRGALAPATVPPPRLLVVSSVPWQQTCLAKPRSFHFFFFLSALWATNLYAKLLMDTGTPLSSTSIHSSDKSTGRHNTAHRLSRGHVAPARAQTREAWLGTQTILVLGAIDRLDVKPVTDLCLRGVHAAKLEGREPLPLLFGVGHPCIARLVRLDRDVVHAVTSFALHLHAHRRPCRPALAPGQCVTARGPGSAQLRAAGPGGSLSAGQCAAQGARGGRGTGCTHP